MQSIGADIQNAKRVKEMLDIFKPDEDGKEIKKIQVVNRKLEIKYEGGEK